MRSLALKTFLTFWLMHAAIFAMLAVLAPPFPTSSGGDGGPSFPYLPLATATLVSAVICFVVARQLAAPLRQLRAASQRLALGDLEARAGEAVPAGSDEIGDLVRDFDAMAERLETMVRSQRQLLSDLSHELRSPLARMQVALALARRKAGPNAERDLARIESEAGRMNDLIGHMLALARAEHDPTAVVAETFDLADIVRNVAAEADYEARQGDRSVRVCDSQQAVVLGNSGLMTSAIENVVRNACRYAPSGTEVQIRLRVAPEHAQITVSDHGPGVPPEELDRIFLAFHRVGSSRDRVSGGVGLGLSIAKRAIRLHGGTIAAINAAGQGLLVTIELPLASEVVTSLRHSYT